MIVAGQAAGEARRHDSGAAAPATPASSASGGAVAASIGDRAIGVVEVDARCGAKCADLSRQIAAQEQPPALPLYRLQAELYAERIHQLDAMVDEILWQSEAAARGLSVRALRDEIRASAPPVSDAEVNRYYSEQGKPSSRSAEKQRERVRPYLHYRAERNAEDAFLATLRARQPVRILLLEPQPPRVALDGGANGFHGASEARVKIIFLTGYRGAESRRLWSVVRVLADEPDTAVAVRPLVAARDEAALDAAAAVRCASPQGRSWEVQQAVSGVEAPLDRPALAKLAARLGLDAAPFAACLDAPAVRTAVATESAAAEQLGLSEPPVLLINGLVFDGSDSAERLRAAVAAEREAKAAAKSPERTPS